MGTMYTAPTCNSWYLGDNIPGKARVFLPYVGGLDKYIEHCDEVVEAGYKGFAFCDRPAHRRLRPLRRGHAGRVRRVLAGATRAVPGRWTEHHGGYWVLSGYDEVAAAFRDWEHFSSARTDPEISSIVLGDSRLPLLTPEEIDPPDWYPLRRILSELLAPRAAERLRPAPATGPRTSSTRSSRRGRMRVHPRLSVPVPGAVTLEWLGFPPSRLDDDLRRLPRRRRVLAGHARTPQRAVRSSAR